MKQQTKISWKPPQLSTLLLYGAATYQATQYASASALVHGDDPLSKLGGLVAGGVVNFSLAYAATQLPKLQAKAEQYDHKGRPEQEAFYARIGFYGLLIISPILIAPANYALMDRSVLAGVWWLQAIWSILWASAMDIAIALVGFIDKSLLSAGSDTERRSTKKPATLNVAASDAERRSTKKSATLSDKPATLWRCECGQTFADRFKYSGHAGKCATHQAAKAGTVIPVDLSKPEGARKQP